MLLFEIASADSIIDWFVESMSAIHRAAYTRAESAFNSSGDPRVARLQGNGVLGKWYSENLITKRRESLESLVNLLKPNTIKLNPIITTGKQKEQMQYSSSRELQSFITRLLPVLKSRGYKTQVSRLETISNTFNTKMEKLFATEPDDEPEQKTKPVVDNTQKDQATKMVMDAIKNLPKDIQHSVRTDVARQGNTLQALKKVLTAKGIKL